MTLWIQPQTETGVYTWHGAAQGVGNASDLAAVCQGADSPRVLLIPGDQVWLTRVGFVPSERRLLAQTVPFVLEEQLAEPPEALHFALAQPDESEVAVAVVSRQSLQQWLAPLIAADCAPHLAIPEPLALPWQPGEWTLHRQGERLQVRTGLTEGWSAEPAPAQWLLQHADTLPEAVTVIGEPPALPDGLAGLPQKHLDGASPFQLEASVALDLLQGEFAPALPWRRWWWQWRWPVGAVAAALLLQFGLALGELWWLQAETLELRRQVEATYREVIPRGALVDPEAQLKRQLAGKEQGETLQFVPLLAQVNTALQQVPAAQLAGLTYSGRRGELRLTLEAPRFADVETLRGAIGQQGLNAALVGSSADGERTRARLKVMMRGRQP